MSFHRPRSYDQESIQSYLGIYNIGRRHSDTDSSTYTCSTSVGFLFPVYSSYKAIRANEQDAIESWLMYWVVMAGLHAVENTVEWAVNW